MKDYYELTKPGLIYGNLIPLIGGFLLASAEPAARGQALHIWLLAATIAGLSLVIASGCVFNNYIDRDIDKKMERTKDRALVAGRVSDRAALIYATCLGAAGFLVLGFFANLLVVGTALFGFFFYIVMYSLWAKRGGSYGALVGSFSGAVPPVVGYCAVSGRLDVAAVILFAMLVFWQMPHFYAIAIRRREEYAAAKIPVLPVAHGIRAAKISMAIYIAAFTCASLLLVVFGYAGFLYGAVTAALGIVWLCLAVRGFWMHNDVRWARGMFFFSLIVLTGVFAVMIFGSIMMRR